MVLIRNSAFNEINDLAPNDYEKGPKTQHVVVRPLVNLAESKADLQGFQCTREVDAFVSHTFLLLIVFVGLAR